MRQKRVGILGGSFNPAHAGHVHISREAIRRMGLDAVWWLVSPQNPLKDTRGMQDFSVRLEKAKNVAAAERRIMVSGFEQERGLRYTAETLSALQREHPKITFVWLMGADNLAQFHRWQQWQAIFRQVTVAVFDRAPFSHAALRSKAALKMRNNLYIDHKFNKNSLLPVPGLLYYHSPRHSLSGTRLRETELMRFLHTPKR